MADATHPTPERLRELIEDAEYGEIIERDRGCDGIANSYRDTAAALRRLLVLESRINEQYQQLGNRPCDCGPYGSDCCCGNLGDLARVAGWDDTKSTLDAIAQASREEDER